MFLNVDIWFETNAQCARLTNNNKIYKKMKISHLCDFVEIVIYVCSFVIIIRQ